MSLIDVRAVTKRYRGLTALDAVDLSVAPGEIVALAGHNGAGKTTLLKLIVGLARPDHGTVTIDGHDMRRAPIAARRHIGFVPQRIQFHDDLATGRLVRHYAALRGVPAPEADAALAGVGLADAAGRPARTLSGGMMQRVGLAIAQLGRPPLLVLDEPMVSLDPDGAALVRTLLAAHRARGGAVLLATHVLADAELLADRVCLLMRGRVIADAPLADLIARFTPALAPALAAWRPEPGLLERVYLAATRPEAAA